MFWSRGILGLGEQGIGRGPTPRAADAAALRGAAEHDRWCCALLDLRPAVQNLRSSKGEIGMSDANKPIKSTRGETALEIVAIALEAVPYVGGVLSSTASYFLDMRKNQRLDDFLTDLAEDLQSVKDQINREFAKSEEFQDLTEDILSKAAETRQQEKLDALRAIFLNTVLSDHPSYDATAEIIDLVHNWQSRHIILLKILDNPLVADEQMGGVVGRGGGLVTSIGQILGRLLPEWDEDQIDRTWQDLYDRQIHRTQGTKTMLTDQGIRQLDGRLTDFGQLVAGYLRNPARR
jgi:hypothetical protein